MDFPFYIDTIRIDLSILYFKGYIYVYEDWFYLSVKSAYPMNCDKVGLHYLPKYLAGRITKKYLIRTEEKKTYNFV